MEHIFVRHAASVRDLIWNRIWFHPNIIVSHDPLLILHGYGKTVRQQKELLVFAELSITTPVLRPETKTAGVLFLILAAVLAAPVPIGISQIHPQTSGSL